MSVYGGLLVLSALAVLGAACVFWPRKIQALYLSREEHSASWNPFLPWMRTESYILTLRLIGVVSVLASVLGIGAVIFGER